MAGTARTRQLVGDAATVPAAQGGSGHADSTGCQCPECGRTWTRAGSLSRRRVRWGGVVAASAIALLAYPASLMPRIEKHGLWSAAPTWALVMFAPVDGFCRGALGCPFSWGTMPAETVELMFPKWNRQYSAWETAILKGRLERGVERVRAEFPARDAVFIASAKYESEAWWGWPGREFTRAERERFSMMAVGAPLRLVAADAEIDPGIVRPNIATPNTLRWSPSGLLVLSTGGRGEDLWLRALRAFDVHDPTGVPLWPGDPDPAGVAYSTVAYDVADLCPALVPNDNTSMSFGMIPLGEPMTPEIGASLQGVLARLNIEAVALPGTPSPNDPPGRISLARSTLFVRQTSAGHARIAELLGAIRSVWPADHAVSPTMATADPTILVRAINVTALLGPAAERSAVRWNAGDVVLSGRVADAAGADTPGSTVLACPVGHVLVIFGTESEQYAAADEIERLRNRPRAAP